MKLSIWHQALYMQFDLKRDILFGICEYNRGILICPIRKRGDPELLREHRLYQADFLMRFYQFRADEIITK